MEHTLLALSLPGGPEWVFIFIIVIVLFGAKRLPELARAVGKSMGEFKKAREEIDQEIAKGAAQSAEAPKLQTQVPAETQQRQP